MKTKIEKRLKMIAKRATPQEYQLKYIENAKDAMANNDTAEMIKAYGDLLDIRLKR